MRSGLDVFAARSAQFRTKYRAICHQLCASSIYAVDSNRSAYTPCSAQYCASPSAHQRRALSVAVAGLRLKRTASLQSVPAMLRFGRFRGAARAISCKVSIHLPPISASSIYAVNSNRSAYPPCSAQYCTSPLAHQRCSLSCGRWPQAQAHRKLAISARNAYAMSRGGLPARAAR